MNQKIGNSRMMIDKKIEEIDKRIYDLAKANYDLAREIAELHKKIDMVSNKEFICSCLACKYPNPEIKNCL